MPCVADSILRDLIDTISAFGRTAGGAIYRLTLSEYDKSAREWLKTVMEGIDHQRLSMTGVFETSLMPCCKSVLVEEPRFEEVRCATRLPRPHRQHSFDSNAVGADLNTCVPN